MHDPVVEGSALSSIINDPSQGFRAVATHGITRESFVDPFNQVVFEVEVMLAQGQPLTQSNIWSRIVAVESSYKVDFLETIFAYGESRPLYWCDLLRKYKLAREAKFLTQGFDKNIQNPFLVEEAISSVTEDLFHLLSANTVTEEDTLSVEDLIIGGVIK